MDNPNSPLPSFPERRKKLFKAYDRLTDKLRSGNISRKKFRIIRENLKTKLRIKFTGKDWVDER